MKKYTIKTQYKGKPEKIIVEAAGQDKGEEIEIYYFDFNDMRCKITINIGTVKKNKDIDIEKLRAELLKDAVDSAMRKL